MGLPRHDQDAGALGQLIRAASPEFSPTIPVRKRAPVPTIIFSQSDQSATEIEVSEGTSLMRAAVSNGVAGIVGECGGQAMCATCHIYVDPEFSAELDEIGEDEEEMLDCTTAARTEYSRLGCQVKMSAKLARIRVSVPNEQV
ncbi:ferredoxin [Arthrobacter sp. MYb211]|nr:ferredoxin [Arthrobacter sp. MYb221]PRC06926.1 ferredoxin [Arthrobacter sp. MYb211]